MAGRKSDFTLTKLDDLFTTQAQREEEKLSKIRDIPLTEIDDFPDHPFKVRDDEDMAQLIESIKERGVITPATVRQKEDGREGQIVYTQQSMFGMVRNVQTCPECNGTGKIIKEKCTSCRGTGYTSSRKKIQVSIPAGIDNGQSIRIRDKGEPGTNGGPRGDLLVEVNVARHPIFQRQDMNIFSTAPLTYAQAALGGEIHINTVDGDVAYEVKPGTQTDTRIRLKGKGVPSLRNKNIRGDHYVTLVVQVPTKLNEEAKEALRKFDEACGNRPAAEPKDGSEKSEKKKKSFMDKIKETFED